MGRILLGVTGSVAAVKTPILVEALREAGHGVKVVPTRHALAFFDLADLGEPPPAPADEPLVVRGQTLVYRDEDEWPEERLFKVHEEQVLHIELRKWADLLLVAPLDANTLGKMALGLCDNLLTCIYRAWDFGRPVVLAPAMNTRMWEHPATSRQLARLMEDHGGRLPPPGFSSDGMCYAINAQCPRLQIVPPQPKTLACGDTGQGALADVEVIVETVGHALGGG